MSQPSRSRYRFEDPERIAIREALAFGKAVANPAELVRDVLGGRLLSPEAARPATI